MWHQHKAHRVDTGDLQPELDVFRAWYNHARPHQNLDGRTPAMAWSDTTPTGRKKPLYVSEWGGLLTGFYFR